VDTVTGNPATVVNDTVNYGWEYVWHCHILGHEENDFMRPMVFDANEATPAAPTFAANAYATASKVLTWTDNAATEYKYQVYTVNGGTVRQVGTDLLANATSVTLTTTTAPSSSQKIVVVAVGAKGNAAAMYGASALPAATGLSYTLTNNGSRLNINWNNVNGASNFVLEYNVNGTGWTAMAPTNSSNGTLNNVVVGSTYQFRVVANAGTVTVADVAVQTATPSTSAVMTVAVIAPPSAPASILASGVTAPTLSRVVVGTGRNQVISDTASTFAVPIPVTGGPVTSYVVEYALDANGTAVTAPTNGNSWQTATTSPANVTAATNFTVTGLPRTGGRVGNSAITANSKFWFRVGAVNSAGTTYSTAVKSSNVVQ
jgi:FtsP/CotA-like multicopper oxidase with cupredoxin domain